MNRFFSTLGIIAAIALSTPSAVAQEADEYEMSANEITKVQTFLIEWGYSGAETREEAFFLPNGKMGPRTKRAIAEAQKTFKWPDTGYLTQVQYRTLMQVGMPDDRVWGALSIARDGSYGMASDYSSGIGAYIAAQEECRGKTSDPCDRAIAAYKRPKDEDRFIAAVWCDDGSGNRTYASAAGISEKKALEFAYANFFEGNWSKSQCTDKVALEIEDGQLYD